MGGVRKLASSPRDKETATLSPEQQAICNHIWKSKDHVIMVEGSAGAGKTHAMRCTIPGIDLPGVFLAPSASASRGTLREEGFANADTIARFNSDPGFREQARNGYIYIDEAPLAGLGDVEAVFHHASELNARVILQGDRKQMPSVQRGNLFPILDRFAGLPIGRLRENRRQKTAGYKAAVNAVAAGQVLKGHDILAGMGCVVQTDSNAPLVEEYMAARAAGKSVLVVAPTHVEKDEITSEIRERLREAGTLGEDTVVDRLIPLAWTDAEKGDVNRFSEDLVVQFIRNSGPFRAGQRITPAELAAHNETPVGKRRKLPDPIPPQHYAVYARGKIAIAPGDTVRVTAGGKVGGHRLDTGSEYTVARVTKGVVELSNGWKLDGFPHFGHGYTGTAYHAQGKTVDRVLIAMGHESRGAMNCAQYYVSVSRGKESAKIFTSLPEEELREAIVKQSQGKTATELMEPGKQPKMRERFLKMMARRVREKYQGLARPSRGGYTVHRSRPGSSKMSKDTAGESYDKLLATVTKQPPRPSPPPIAESADGEDLGPCVSRPGEQVHNLPARPQRRGAGAVFPIRPHGRQERLRADRFAVLFAANEGWKIVVEGTNLWRVYNHICQHRLEWIRKADRGFDPGDGQPFITAISVVEVKDKT